MAFALRPLAARGRDGRVHAELRRDGASSLFAFFFAYYIYEPPYRGLYPDLLPDGSSAGRRAYSTFSAGARSAGRSSPAVSCSRLGTVRRSCSPPGSGSSRGRRRRPRARATATASADYDAVPLHLAAPWRIVTRERNVRLFLLANTAWEATFAGMYTFVVLYVTRGSISRCTSLPLVLAVVAGGYVAAAIVAGRFGDHFGIGRVIIGASCPVRRWAPDRRRRRQTWHVWYYALLFPIAVAEGRS